MITNKDIRVENGNLVLNGDKFPLDGQSPETIMEIVEDNSDTTPTENSTAPVTSGGVFTALGTKQDTLTFDTTPTDASTNPVTSGGVYNTIGDLTQTGVTGADVAAQLGVLGSILSYTHFVQIPFSTSVLDSIEAAFENGTIPVDVYGITFGIVRGDAGSQRAVFIAQNQSLGATQTRCGAIYFGSYTAPHYCYKQDSAAWVDTAL